MQKDNKIQNLNENVNKILLENEKVKKSYLNFDPNWGRFLKSGKAAVEAG